MYIFKKTIFAIYNYKAWVSVDKVFYQQGHIWLEEKKTGKMAQWLRCLLHKHQNLSLYPKGHPQSTTVVWFCNPSARLGWGRGMGWWIHCQASLVNLWKFPGSVRDSASKSKLESGGRRHLILTSGFHVLMYKPVYLDTRAHRWVIHTHIHKKWKLYFFLLFNMFIPVVSYSSFL